MQGQDNRLHLLDCVTRLSGNIGEGLDCFLHLVGYMRCFTIMLMIGNGFMNEV